MRTGLWIAAAALAALSACGSAGDATEPEPTPSSTSATPELLELADACVEVNATAEQILVDAVGIADPGLLFQFSNSVEQIAARTDDRGRDSLEDLAQRAREVRTSLNSETDPTARLEAGTEMLAGYKRLQDSCQAVGAPISLPGTG